MAQGNPVGAPASVPSIHPRAGRVIPFPAGTATCLDFAERAVDRTAFRVLLAHDLTGQSEIALVRAARLVFERDGHLTIVHVVDSAFPASVIEARRKQARHQIEVQVRRWLGRRAVPPRIEIGVGDPADAIAARVQARNFHLVVTGRHQRHAIAAMFGTSTVGRLLKRIKRPLLAVGNPNQSPYRRVLVPIDCTEASAARVTFVAALLPGAGFHLLHAETGCVSDCVASMDGRSLASFVSTLELGGRRAIVSRQSGDALTLVRKELARQKTDLLVLGAHARFGIGRTVLGDVAETNLLSSGYDTLLLSTPT